MGDTNEYTILYNGIKNNPANSKLTDSQIRRQVEILLLRKLLGDGVPPEYDASSTEKHPIFAFFDSYEKELNNSDIINHLEMIVAAIYLEYKTLFKGLNIFLLYRTKGGRSFNKNLDKTIPKTDGYSDTKIDVDSDILGIKIVIDSVPDPLPFDLTDPRFSKVYELYDQKSKNISFIQKAQKWINNYYSQIPDKSIADSYNGKTYYSYKVDLLKRLKACSYDKYSDDENAGNPYSRELNKAFSSYESQTKAGTFSFDITKKEMEDIQHLVHDLEDRLNEKLENEILKATIPIVLNQPLIRDTLQVRYRLKASANRPEGLLVKTGGYSALFNILTFFIKTPNSPTPLEVQIELQGNSKRAYEIGKTDHESLANKKVHIYEIYYTLTNKEVPQHVIDEILNDLNEEDKAKFLTDKTSKNHFILEYYINKLDSISSNVLESDEEKYSKTRDEVNDLLEYIELKSYIGSEDNKVPASEYLYSSLPYLCARLYTTNAGRISYADSVVLRELSPRDRLLDVLRSKDGISVLAYQLSKLLEKYPTSPDKQFTKNDIRKDVKEAGLIVGPDGSEKSLPNL